MNSRVDGVEYYQTIGQICNRLGSQLYSEYEAKNACSEHDNCIAYMNTKFGSFPCGNFSPCDPVDDERQFFLCFNKGNTPFQTIKDVDGNKDERVIIYKKDIQGKQNAVAKTLVFSSFICVSAN